MLVVERNKSFTREVGQLETFGVLDRIEEVKVEVDEHVV